MKTDKSEQLFLVLVPHRDARLVLRSYSADLLKAGLQGAYGVPWVAPLAALSRPLNTQELKNIAHAFRKSAINGKFNAGETHAMPFPLGDENGFLSGPRFDLPIPPDLPTGGISHFFTTTVIGACLLRGNHNENALPRPPALSFSAAAVSNMYWRPVNLPGQNSQSGALGYKWKIDKLIWLPKKHK